MAGRRQDLWVARRVDQDGVAAVMAAAFHNDPVARWILPDPGPRVRTLAAIVPLYAGAAFDRGCAWVWQEFAGAALWLPSGVSPDESAMLELLERRGETAVPGP